MTAYLIIAESYNNLPEHPEVMKFSSSEKAYQYLACEICNTDKLADGHMHKLCQAGAYSDAVSYYERELVNINNQYRRDWVLLTEDEIPNEDARADQVLANFNAKMHA